MRNSHRVFTFGWTILRTLDIAPDSPKIYKSCNRFYFMKKGCVLLFWFKTNSFILKGVKNIYEDVFIFKNCHWVIQFLKKNKFWAVVIMSKQDSNAVTHLLKDGKISYGYSKFIRSQTSLAMIQIFNCLLSSWFLK